MAIVQPHQYWPNRFTPWLFGLLVCGGLFFGVARWQEVPLGAVTDDAIYIEMARSLAEGQGAVIATGPDVPATNPQIFPSGFPLLLAPLARLAPRSLAIFSLVPVSAALLILWFGWHLPQVQGRQTWRWMIMSVILLNPWFVSWSSRILSDLPYTAFSLAVMWLFLKAAEQNFRCKRTLVGLVFLCAAAVSVRTVGWALVAAISVVFWSQRRWWFGLGFPVAVATAMTPIWTIGHNATGPLTKAYTSQMLGQSGSELWQLILTNTSGYLAELPVLLIPIFGQPLAQFADACGVHNLYLAIMYLSGLCILVLLIRGLNSLRHGTPSQPQSQPQAVLFSAYIVFYTMALSVFDGYPSGVQTRLLLPLLPLLVWLIFMGCESISRRLPYWLFAAMILTSLAHNGWRISHPLRTTVEANGHGMVDPSAGAFWLIKHSQADNIVMAQEPLPRHIHWRRPTVAFPTTLSPDEVIKRCFEFEVSYIFIGPSIAGKPRQLDPENRQLQLILQAAPDRFVEVMSDHKQKIYFYQLAW